MALHDHSRWGPTDQIGAGNLLTAEKRLAALQSVREGRVYDVSHDISMGAPFMASGGISAISSGAGCSTSSGTSPISP